MRGHPAEPVSTGTSWVWGLTRHEANSITCTEPPKARPLGSRLASREAYLRPEYSFGKDGNDRTSLGRNMGISVGVGASRLGSLHRA